MENKSPKILRKPEWLKIKLPNGINSIKVVGLLNSHGLNTICASGLCPNKGECWGRGTATFMIGGDVCTRTCKFCNVKSGKPSPLDSKEIDDIVNSVKQLNLKHVVLTSVDRDDLKDLGVSHWCKVIKKLKEECPDTTMEVLIPDFQGKLEYIRQIIKLQPDIISHNMETVKRLTPEVRSVAKYETSIQVIKEIAKSGVRSKSGLMLGLGETESEIIETLRDLRSVGCEVVTIGQYLQPTKNHFPVKEYVHPDKFEEYKKEALKLGFRHVESGPLVRSSYHAEKHIE